MVPPASTLQKTPSRGMMQSPIVETSELAAGALSREAVLFLKVGLCGGFTTFSTFSLETLELIEGGQYAIAGAYALVSVVLCVAGVLVGKVLARALMPTG